MKNLLLLIILVPLMCFSQKREKPIKTSEMLKQIEGKWELDDNENVSFVKIIDSINLTQDEIYSRALAYFTYNYVKGDWVVQVQDKDRGLIIGKGVYPDVHTDLFILNTIVFDTYHLLRVDVKEGRARIVATLSGYRETTHYYNAPNSVNDRLLKTVFPVNEKGIQKKIYTRAFYYSYLQAQESLKDLENAIRFGNTSSTIENEDW